MFIYRLYTRRSAQGSWVPFSLGQVVAEWTDKDEAEQAFDSFVSTERGFRERDGQFGHLPTDFRLVRIYADAVKEFQ